MGALTNSTVDIGSKSKIQLNEPCSVKFQFRNSDSFYINQTVDNSVRRTVISEEPLPEVDPEITVIISQKLDSILNMGSIFLDTPDVQIRTRRPDTDKTKAMLLVNNVIGEL